ncbi:hypothetical protein GWK47_027765 [Chionoecetes opilio]|uniref:Glycosyltransferase family 92 protein n=1 Tax=Chionoecetes opilio TaxID=41210 RepID=A0A8J8W930_CHIOP|nr:hypothetical protein GWK47_027765 [Chionoecetes opilio]
MVRGWAAAVCGPALFYYHEDFSTRLVEWLELMRAQGFSQVFLHVTEVHPNIIKVLRHYTQEGFVEVTDYTYPSPYLNDPDLRSEVLAPPCVLSDLKSERAVLVHYNRVPPGPRIRHTYGAGQQWSIDTNFGHARLEPMISASRVWVMVERSKMLAQENVYFNDCILRHMHRYRFIAHFDPDEVPILLKHDNFTHLLDDLMASQKGKTPPGYNFQLTFFYDNLDPHEEAADVPHYLWALRHTLRQAPHETNPYPNRYKSLFDMNTVRGIYSHTTLVCLSGPCDFDRSRSVSNDTGLIAHYRNMCGKKCMKNTLHDLTLLKYKKQVGARVLKVLSTLQLL